MKSHSFNEPAVFTAIEWDGSHLYRWNIESEILTDDEGNELTSYTYDEIRVWEPLTESKLLDKVLQCVDGYSDMAQIALEKLYADIGKYDDDEAQEKTDAYNSLISSISSVTSMVASDWETYCEPVLNGSEEDDSTSDDGDSDDGGSSDSGDAMPI